jgi:hypothetical protein
MNTWPDPWLHSSEDRPDKIDPTQMKRAAVIAAAAAYTIASADDKTAGQIGAEIVSNASARIGHQLARGLEEIKRADRDSIARAFKKARAYVEASLINELATLESVKQLAGEQNRFAKYLDELKVSVTKIEQAALKTLDNNMVLSASLLGVQPVSSKLSSAEAKAAAIVPRPTPLVKESGFEGYLSLIGKIAAPEGIGALNSVTKRLDAEMRLLCNGQNSALGIKKMLDTEFQQETSLETIVSRLEVLKRAGLVAF